MVGILNILLDYGRQRILREWMPDSCIASTAIALDVLEYFSIPARPLPVVVSIFNPEAVQMLDKGITDMNEWNKVGAWSVGVGMGERAFRPDRWSGHLVALVDETILLDLSLDQASRTEKGIILTPTKAPMPDDFFTGSPLVGELNGCTVIYKYKANEEFRNAPDWKEKRRRRTAVYDIIGHIERNSHAEIL